MLADLVIDRLGANAAPALVDLLSLATQQDRQFFTPFAYTTEAVSAVFATMVHDRMYGISLRQGNEATRLIGFYMLRGLDEGFKSPMYGVYVSPRFRRHGVATLSVRHAITVCKIGGLPSLLLKVYPENRGALSAYGSLGFKHLREDPPQRVMQLVLQSHADTTIDEEAGC